ncbi:MAG TPA: asparagine synthase (glutamine-hydrolyzing) [bacterium]|nr:asparagine synthase (glutamine-hydrolyzing) [bacterium]
MCGIAGVVSQQPIDQQKAKKMTATLAKRGPDAVGHFFEQHCFLGQTRLSIIDLVGGQQPMSDEETRLTITFNGEIYNFRELKQELEQRGYNFKTRSDTEVILKSYQEYGEECPKKLDGMFAFAIWDGNNKKLFAARDRFGKKPLYYALTKDKIFLFASEIKALLASGLIRGEVDRQAIDDYLRLLYIPPDKTVYHNIQTLKPATSLSYNWHTGETKTKQYWRLEKKPMTIDYEEAKARFWQILNRAVAKRLVADVEVGTFLSGGVDSSAVSLLAQNNTRGKIKTFSAGFENLINELPFAEQTAKAIGSEHFTKQISGNLIDWFLKVNAYFDEPFADSSNVAVAMLSSVAREKVKVVLGGDGADELLLGYGWYRMKFNWHWRKIWKQPFFKTHWQRYWRKMQYFKDEERGNLWQKEVKSDFNQRVDNNLQARDPDERINEFDLKYYLTGDILTKVDRAAMINSLEVRSPFLDTDLAEFIYNLPANFKSRGDEGKIIFKDTLRGKLPDAIINRKKQGFGAPVNDWLRRPDFQALVQGTLGSPQAHIYQMFNWATVNRLREEFYQKNITANERAYKIWLLLNLELWFKNYHQYHA